MEHITCTLNLSLAFICEKAARRNRSSSCTKMSHASAFLSYCNHTTFIYLVLCKVRKCKADRPDTAKISHSIKVRHSMGLFQVHVAFFSGLNFSWETRKRMEFLTRNEKKTRKILPHKMMIIVLQIYERLYFLLEELWASLFFTFFSFLPAL